MMNSIRTHRYFVYITTNIHRTVLYTGITNNLKRRLSEHKQNAATGKRHFAGRYNAYYLVFWEHFQYVNEAIRREKQLKGWLRVKKEKLITDFNPS